MTTVEKIIQLLTDKNVEQQALASYLGVKKQTISDWKSGKTKSYKGHINKIAEFFGVSTDYLLGNETSGTKPTDEDIKFALFDGTEGVTDEMYDEVKRFARFIKFENSEKPAIEHTYKAIARTSDGSSKLREPPTDEQMASFEEVTDDNF